MMRRLLTLLVVPLVTVALAAPAHAEEAWHPVDEEWQPYVQGDLDLPADRYCGDFAVHSTPVRQDIVFRVVSRWESGGPRDVEYRGPLITEATNTTTGESVRLNMSGRAYTQQRPDGSLSTYEAIGPVGFGWPTGSVGLPQGYYVFRGRHVVEFPRSAPRRLVVDQGPETDICALLR
jgi:hypothetical protein